MFLLVISDALDKSIKTSVFGGVGGGRYLMLITDYMLIL